MSTSDLHLTRRLLAGEEAGFDAFFGEYFPRVYRFARIRVGGDEDAAEEIAQTTLIKALAKVHTYRGEAALFTWLCTFCRHEIDGWFERTGRHAHLSLTDDSAESRAVLGAIAALSGDDPEHQYERSELARLVHVALDHLPGGYRDALVWKYLQELSVEDIGRRLGLSYKAAESHLTRSREAFREAFALIAGGTLPRPSPTAGTED